MHECLEKFQLQSSCNIEISLRILSNSHSSLFNFCFQFKDENYVLTVSYGCTFVWNFLLLLWCLCMRLITVLLLFLKAGNYYDSDLIIYCNIKVSNTNHVWYICLSNDTEQVRARSLWVQSISFFENSAQILETSNGKMNFSYNAIT